MAIGTHSRFYYGYVVTAINNQIDFDEGAGELTAVIPIGEYTLTEFAQTIEDQLNLAGTLTYTVAVNRTTRVLTISAGANFDLLVSSGTHFGTSAYTTMGFTGPDLTGASSYFGSTTGNEYVTQFFIQDFTHADDWKRAIDATVNKTASGRVEVVNFGQESFFEWNFRFVTDRDMTGSFIRNNATGRADLRALMDFLITKSPVEFMPDEDDQATFYKVMIEATPDSSSGTGYKLNEMDSMGLPGFFETGTLKFRRFE